jgi:hypothetical protein
MRTETIAKLAFVFIVGTALGTSVSLGKPKRDSFGCTAKQLQSVSASQCPADLVIILSAWPTE